jgi:hypothetical protein
MIGPKKLEELVEKAHKAFWIEVAKEFPEFDVENLDHGSVIVLQWQMKVAIEKYISENIKAEEEIKSNGGIQGNPNPTRDSRRNGKS